MLAAHESALTAKMRTDLAIAHHFASYKELQALSSVNVFTKLKAKTRKSEPNRTREGYEVAMGL